MQIGIDVGYSYTKAVTPERRLLTPSVVAPYRELALADLAQSGVGHSVEIRKADGEFNKYFVGNLALREGQAVSLSMDREKHRHPNHDILILTSARLLGAGVGSSLGVGLPVAYYRAQREETRQHLLDLHAVVSVDKGNPARISFGDVLVYPQGAGALLTAPDLPGSGYVLLVDVGYKTTDYIVVEVKGGVARPVSSLCGSVETGVYNVHAAIAADYQERTGAPLAVVRIPEIIKDNGKIHHYGREIDIGGSIAKVATNTAANIADQVKAQLGDRAAFIRITYLAGGGVNALPMLSTMFTAAKILPESQWANAFGFLQIVARSKAL